MADTIQANLLPQTATYNPDTDFFMLLRGDGNGPASGPYLLFASSVVASGGGSGGDGGGDYGYGGGPFGGGTTVSVTSVFGRQGVVSAQIGDYTAAKITYSAGATGIPAVTVQEAIDYIAENGGGGGGSGLPTGGSEGQVATRDGAGGVIWGDQVLISVFGRDGIVIPMTGDYHADQIALTTDGSTPTVNRFVTASDVAKITALDLDLQTPDRSGASENDVLSIDSGGDMVWAAPTGGSGSSVAQIDLMPHLRPDSASPPTWVYDGGAGTWQFSNSGTQVLHAEFRWPGGSNQIELVTTAAVTTGSVKFGVYVSAITPDSADLYDKSYGTINSDTVTVRDAVKKTSAVVIAITNDDSAAAGDYVRIKIVRDNTVGSNSAGTASIRMAALVPVP